MPKHTLLSSALLALLAPRAEGKEPVRQPDTPWTSDALKSGDNFGAALDVGLGIALAGAPSEPGPGSAW